VKIKIKNIQPQEGLVKSNRKGVINNNAHAKGLTFGNLHNFLVLILNYY